MTPAYWDKKVKEFNEDGSASFKTRDYAENFMLILETRKHKGQRKEKEICEYENEVIVKLVE